MKALTLTQPWATLVALGAKRIETRSWGTPYRGPLAIHAAKGFPPEAKALCLMVPFYNALKKGGRHISHTIMAPPEGVVPHDLPLGAVVATCHLVGCYRTEDPFIRILLETGTGAPFEQTFGDYSPGRWAWVLDGIKPLPEPIPARGALGLWEWAAPAEVQP